MTRNMGMNVCTNLPCAQISKLEQVANEISKRILFSENVSHPRSESYKLKKYFLGHKCLSFEIIVRYNIHELQAGAPEGACHDNVKSLGKKYHSIVGLSFTNIWTYSGKAYVIQKIPQMKTS